MPLLAEKYHVFALDLVGFGQSEKPKIKYSKDIWVEHLITFIETRMKPPVTIVGNSLGGCLSLHLSQSRPDLIKKQVLMGAPG
jgi:2-hydroxymuconate-semialdehyde hydrolase